MNKGLLFAVALTVGFLSGKALKKLMEDNRTDKEKIHEIHEKYRKSRGWAV